MWYVLPVIGIMHIKDKLLLIGKSSPCGSGSGFPLSLFQWLFTTCVECVIKYNISFLLKGDNKKNNNVIVNVNIEIADIYPILILHSNRV